jgi:site-specific recombinase XerC
LEALGGMSNSAMAKNVLRPAVPSTTLTVADLPAQAQERVRRHQTKAKAKNTSRAYASQLRAFKAWCQREGYSDAAPVAPAIVTSWLLERADAGASRSTLAVALAAIKAGHRAAKQRFDAADPDLIEALSGARREAVREERQAAPLRPALLKDVLDGLEDGDLDRRDCAMLSVLYMLALRRSELVEIDFERRGDGLAVLRMTDHGLELELLRSKSSQEAPVRIEVDRQHNPRGFAEIEQWIAHAKIAPGTALFRRIRPRGGIGERISADGVNRAIKAAIKRYYLSTGAADAVAERLAARFSGHSGRVGFVVAAKEAGAADTDIAATTRHKSLAMIKRYGEVADQRRRAPHQLKGVGL